jgi:hypothetical protein
MRFLLCFFAVGLAVAEEVHWTPGKPIGVSLDDGPEGEPGGSSLA